MRGPREPDREGSHIAFAGECTMGTFLRVTFAPFRRAGEVDGAWWPRSRDLDTELAELFPPIQRRFGQIKWLRLSWADWDTHPDRAGDGVPIGWNRQMLTHLLVAHCLHGTAVFLLVVPADTEPHVARRALMLAADAQWTPRGATDVLTQAGIRPASR